MQGQPASGTGESGRDGDQLPADGGGGGAGVEGRRGRAGGAGEVERDRGADQPGGVRGELRGGQVTPGGEQLTLFTVAGWGGGGVEPADPAHDQPGGDVVGSAAAGERCERHFGDLRVGDPPLLGLVPDRLRVADGGPPVGGNGADGGGHGLGHPGGDGEPGAGSAGGGDHVVGVVRRVRGPVSVSV